MLQQPFFQVKGMDSDPCALNVQNVIRSFSGVENVQTEINNQRVSISYDSSRLKHKR
jgi:copper chaperone CopZ